MKAHRLKTTGLIIVLTSAAFAARAAEEGNGLFEFDAFGTLGVVHSSEDKADFTRNILVPNGVGASHEWSPKVDSVLGGQVTAHFTSKVSAVLQLVSEQRHENSYEPRVEWANLKYAITPDLSLAVGRTAAPVLMLTDTRRVSYALPWIRPPLEVYEQYPITSNDGVNLHWRTRVGDATQTLELAYGRSDTHYSRDGSTGEARSRKQLILRSTLERGALSVSMGYSPAHLSLPTFAPLFDAFRQFGPPGQAIADRYSADDRSARYIGAGVNYDPGHWFAMIEWAHVKVDGAIGGHWGWYASTGLRHGPFTPYATWGRMRPSHDRSEPGLNLTMLPPAAVPVAGALNAQLNAILANVPDQSTLSGGVRWDFAPSLCVKLQYDHVDLAPGNTGTLTNFQVGFQPGGKVNVLGVSVSFVL